MQRALSEQGGRFFVHHEVKKVLVQDSEARGIRLANGIQVEARKIIVSNLDIGQTINRLLADQETSRKIRGRPEVANRRLARDVIGGRLFMLQSRTARAYQVWFVK